MSHISILYERSLSQHFSHCWGLWTAVYKTIAYQSQTSESLIPSGDPVFAGNCKKCGPSTQGASQSGAAMTFQCTGSLPRLVQVFKRRNAKCEGFLASSEAKMRSVGVFDARTIMLLPPWADYTVVFIKRAYCVREKGGRELGRRVTLIPELSGWQRLALWFLHPPVPLRLNFICMRLCGAARVLHTPVSSPLDYLLEICVGGLRIFPAYCSPPQRKVSSC